MVGLYWLVSPRKEVHRDDRLRMAALRKSLEHGVVERRGDGERVARFFNGRDLAVAGIAEFPSENRQGNGR